MYTNEKKNSLEECDRQKHTDLEGRQGNGYKPKAVFKPRPLLPPLVKTSSKREKYPNEAYDQYIQTEHMRDKRTKKETLKKSIYNYTQNKLEFSDGQ